MAGLLGLHRLPVFAFACRFSTIRSLPRLHCSDRRLGDLELREAELAVRSGRTDVADSLISSVRHRVRQSGLRRLRKQVQRVQNLKPT